MQATNIDKGPRVKATHIAQAAHQEAAQYLTFHLGHEVHAVGILAVKEIIQYGQVTEVPMAPQYIRGVINLRGAVVPVIDLNARFGRGVAAQGRRSCIVIIEITHDDAPLIIGLMVDAVSAVLTISSADIDPVPSFGVGLRADFIQGMARLKEQFIMILDVGRTFAMPELAHLGWSADAAPSEAH